MGGAEAEAFGYGGLAAVSRATGLASSTIQKGRRELREGASLVDLVNVRRKGSGRRGNTTNSEGLVVKAQLDKRNYPTGKKISQAQMRELNIEPHKFHGDWNYTIKPRL